MTVFSELDTTLRAMDFAQLLLAFVFLLAYALALGQLLGVRGRLRAAGVAVLAAIGFVAVTRPWVHGALLVSMVVAGIGVFIVLAWALSLLAGYGRRALMGEARAPEAVSAPAQPGASLAVLQSEPVSPAGGPARPQQIRPV